MAATPRAANVSRGSRLRRCAVTLMVILALTSSSGGGGLVVADSSSPGAALAPSGSVVPMATVALSVSPTTKSVAVNKSFDLNVVIAAGSNAVMAADIHLSYDPNSVIMTAECTAGNALPAVAGSQYDNLKGTLDFGAYTTGSAATGTFTLCTLHLRSLAATPSAGTLIKRASAPLVVGPGGTPVYTITWTNGKVVISAPIEQTNTSLTTGWNMVSFYVQPFSAGVPITSVQAILASLDGRYDLVQAYVASDSSDPWKTFDPAAGPNANDLTALELGQGFFVHMKESATWTLSGKKVYGRRIQLYAGSNLVGWPLAVNKGVNAALESIQGYYTAVWTQDASDAAGWLRYTPNGAAWANDLTQMSPGRSYWVDTTRSCKLLIVQ